MPQQQGEPAPFAHYPTPGLTLIGTMPQGPIRGLRQATNDAIFICAGSGIYVVTATSPLTVSLLGSITAGLTTPVSMQDNSTTLVIVDGTSGGWTVDLASNAFAPISDPTGMFAGADRVDVLDTYLLFNKPGTPQFYSSNSLAVTFDTLYFADKSSYPDLLVTLAVAKREIWLLGERTTEIWYNAGSSDFPFARIPSTFVDHGCIAKYSVAIYDNSIFWLTLDRQGAAMLIQGAGYQTKRLSNYAVEQAWADYPTLADAIGFVYLIGGHTVYVLSFPTADHTWCYDVTTGLWHEWLWVDNNGNEHRSRCNCAYPMTSGQVFAGDWQNGNLYLIDHNNYTDNGQPIKRQRSWQHVLNDGKRVFHREFIADFETGMGGIAPPSQPQTLVKCFFNGPDGTPVEGYSPSPIETNATWYSVTGRAVLLGSAAVSQNGAATYASSGPFPPIADYSIAFRVWPEPTADVGSSALVSGRGSASNNGYSGGIEVLSGSWYAVLYLGAVPAVPMPVGVPPAGGWFDCVLTMVGSLITLQVQRSSDGFYLGNDGQWHSTSRPALSATDTALTAPGRITFGLNAIPSGVMGTEDGTGTWVLEDGSPGSWEWDEVPTDSLGLDNIIVTTIPTPWHLWLDWSDDRGHTYGNPVPQNMGAQGEYLTQCQWQRLGYGRDRVWRLTWNAPLRTALQGAWFEAQPALS
jgi:hypothetical protein